MSGKEVDDDCWVWGSEKGLSRYEKSDSTSRGVLDRSQDLEGLMIPAEKVSLVQLCGVEE